jgi:hypothetical protein
MVLAIESGMTAEDIALLITITQSTLGEMITEATEVILARPIHVVKE